MLPKAKVDIEDPLTLMQALMLLVDTNAIVHGGTLKCQRVRCAVQNHQHFITSAENLVITPSFLEQVRLRDGGGRKLVMPADNFLSRCPDLAIAPHSVGR